MDEELKHARHNLRGKLNALKLCVTALEVLTGPYEFAAVKAALERAGFKAEIAEVTMKPGNETELAGDDAQKMQKMLDALEGLDDVQGVYTSAVFQ